MKKPILSRNQHLKRMRDCTATFEALLLENKKSSFLGRLTARGSIESAHRNANPVNVIPPIDSYSLFFEPTDPSILALPGINPRTARYDPSVVFADGSSGTWQRKVSVDNRLASKKIGSNRGGLTAAAYWVQIPLIYDTPGQGRAGYNNPNASATVSELAGVMGRIRYRQNRNNRDQIDGAVTNNVYQSVAGFTSRVIQNRDIFDYENNLLSGDSNLISHNFLGQNFAIEQLFFDGAAGIEAAYDNQTFERDRLFLFNSGQNGGENGQNAIKIDVAEYLSNDEPNPNYGRPFIVQNLADDSIRKR